MIYVDLYIRTHFRTYASLAVEPEHMPVLDGSPYAQTHV